MAVAPCLIMTMAAIALWLVNHGFGRLRQALPWAIGAACASVQWAILAVGPHLPGARGFVSPAAHILSLVAAALLVEGFRTRRGSGAAGATLPVVAAGAIGMVLAADLLPTMPLRWSFYPFASLLLAAWATRLVWSGASDSRTEWMVGTLLAAIALVNLAALLATIGAPGAVAAPSSMTRIYLAASGPTTAARALAMLTIIAVDYARELRRLLHTDPLTGVLNRQGFDHAVRALFSRRKGRLALVLADIDHFKEVNDRHGHAVGDAALAAFGAHLARHAEREGVIGRLGGEEFALLLPGADAAAARRCAEAIRDDLRHLGVPADRDLRLSASFGVAERAGREAFDALIERADRALYRSKREGRNRTTLAGEDDR